MKTNADGFQDRKKKTKTGIKLKRQLFKMKKEVESCVKERKVWFKVQMKLNWYALIKDK